MPTLYGLYLFVVCLCRLGSITTVWKHGRMLSYVIYSPITLHESKH